MSIKVEVGKRLKESRKNMCLTQKQIANLLKMTQQQYSRFENRIFELNYEELIFLCNLFDVSSDFILGLSDY